jgi:hypothetical protein
MIAAPEMASVAYPVMDTNSHQPNGLPCDRTAAGKKTRDKENPSTDRAVTETDDPLASRL